MLAILQPPKERSELRQHRMVRHVHPKPSLVILIPRSRLTYCNGPLPQRTNKSWLIARQY